MSYRPEGWEDKMFEGQKYTPEYYGGYEDGADAILEALIKKGVSTNPFRTNSNPIYITNPRKNGVYVFIEEEKK